MSTEYRMKLLDEYIERTTFITEKMYDTIRYAGDVWVDDIFRLRELRRIFLSGEKHYYDEENDISFEKDKDDCILSHEGFECVFGSIQFEELLMCMLDILEETLPLGTVVNLNKKVYGDIKEMEQIENLRIVITHRFLIKDDDGYYFPYAGVVYPTGMMFDNSKVFHFTAPLIERVVHRGFSDEADEVFCYYMKQELIIDHNLHSYGYATEEVFNKIKEATDKLMKEVEEKHE